MTDAPAAKGVFAVSASKAPPTNRRIEILQRIPILEGLSADELGKVLEVMTESEVSPGEEIIREGEPGDTLYVLVEGSVQVSKAVTLKISRRDFGEKEKRLSVLEGRHLPVFGEVALLENSERTATVTALAQSRLLQIERSRFERLCDQEPVIGCRILRNIAKDVCARLRKADSDILKLTTALSLALK